MEKRTFWRRLLSLPLALLALALPLAAHTQSPKPGDTLSVAFNRADNVIRGTSLNDCGMARALDAAYQEQFPTALFPGKHGIPTVRLPTSGSPEMPL